MSLAWTAALLAVLTVLFAAPLLLGAQFAAQTLAPRWLTLWLGAVGLLLAGALALAALTLVALVL